jgi:general secretion pathway protein K
MTSRAALSRAAWPRAARGAAVILAMLLAALAATVAATLFAEEQRWTRAVADRRDQVQAQALAIAGVQWARQILDTRGQRKRIDHLGETWALTLPPIPIDNGEIRGAIADATARLNVNTLAVAPGGSDVERRRFERLFAARGGPLAAIDAIADWIDVDGNTRPNGAEDAYYGEQDVPGVAANVPVVRVAELANVRGVALPALAAAAPYLTALPAGTPINVNTAPPEVLAALVDGLDGDRLAALVAARAARPFESIGDFRARLPQGTKLATDEALDVKSDYFFVTVEARQGTTIARARALVKRGAGNTWPAIVWQVVE